MNTANQHGNHPEAELLARFADGLTISWEEKRSIEGHLAICDICRATVELAHEWHNERKVAKVSDLFWQAHLDVHAAEMEWMTLFNLEGVMEVLGRSNAQRNERFVLARYDDGIKRCTVRCRDGFAELCFRTSMPSYWKQLIRFVMFDANAPNEPIQDQYAFIGTMRRDRDAKDEKVYGFNVVLELNETSEANKVLAVSMPFEDALPWLFPPTEKRVPVPYTALLATVDQNRRGESLKQLTMVEQDGIVARLDWNSDTNRFILHASCTEAHNIGHPIVFRVAVAASAEADEIKNGMLWEDVHQFAQVNESIELPVSWEELPNPGDVIALSMFRNELNDEERIGEL